MSLKDKLIKLGSENPELQHHLKPILDRVSAMGYEHDPRLDGPEELKEALIDEGWKELVEPKRHQRFEWEVRKSWYKIRWFPGDKYVASKISQGKEEGDLVMSSKNEEEVYHFATRKVR